MVAGVDPAMTLNRPWLGGVVQTTHHPRSGPNNDPQSAMAGRGSLEHPPPLRVKYHLKFQAITGSSSSESLPAAEGQRFVCFDGDDYRRSWHFPDSPDNELTRHLPVPIITLTLVILVITLTHSTTSMTGRGGGGGVNSLFDLHDRERREGGFG